MNSEELVKAVKHYCNENQMTYVDDIRIGNDILILVLGDNAADKLKNCLTDLKVKHTTPMAVSDAIGSYVSL